MGEKGPEQPGADHLDDEGRESREDRVAVVVEELWTILKEFEEAEEADADYHEVQSPISYRLVQKIKEVEKIYEVDESRPEGEEYPRKNANGIEVINADMEKILQPFLRSIMEKPGIKDVRVVGSFQIIEGKVNGAVYLTDSEPDGKYKGRSRSRYLPVINSELIERIDGEEIMSAYNVENVDGKFNGSVSLTDDSSFPVIDGVPVREIGGKKIDGTLHERNIGGKLNGIVVVEGKRLPVILGELIEQEKPQS